MKNLTTPNARYWRIGLGLLALLLAAAVAAVVWMTRVLAAEQARQP